MAPLLHGTPAGLRLALLLLRVGAARGDGFVQGGVAGTWSQLYSAPAPAPTPEEHLPDIQIDGVDRVKSWARERVARGEQLFAASALTRQASPTTWAGVVIYQLMPDRFNNGNPDNDLINIQQVQKEAMAANDYKTMPDWRHGGDLQGIRDRLGYLADLGVQALWITPVLMNDGGYHGYCNTDLTTTDPSFGSPEELRDLVADAHRHGIYVVLDVVVNHLCNVDTHYASSPDHEACAQHWNDLYWKGRAAANYTGVSMNFSANFFPPFRSEAFFNRCGPNSVEDTSGETAAAIFGDFVDGMFDYNTQNHDFQEIFTNLLKYWVAFADLDGLRLDAAKHITVDFTAYVSTELREYARNIGKPNFLVIGEEAAQDEDWKAMSLGKMDSVPTSPVETVVPVPNALTQRLIDLKSTYLANPQFPAPGLSSLYNFNMSGTARDALRCEQVSSTVEAYFSSYARRTLLSQSVPQKGAEPDAQLWTCIELHDWPRFLGLTPHRETLLTAAVTWLLTAPGAPILYYGVEQGYNGNCPAASDLYDPTVLDAVAETCSTSATERYGKHQDSLKRQDMFLSGPWRLDSAVAEVNRTANVTRLSSTVNKKPWREDEMLPRGHSMYRHVQRMVAFRRSCPALTQGSTLMHEAANFHCGFLAYSRLPFGAGGAGEVIVLLNPGGLQGGDPETKNDAPFQNLPLNGAVDRTSGQRYVNAMNTNQSGVVQRNQDGSQVLHFDESPINLPPGGFALLIQEGYIAPFNDSLGIALCKGGAAFMASKAEATPGPLARSMWYIIGGVALAIPAAGIIWGCLSKDKNSEPLACAGESDASDNL